MGYTDVRALVAFSGSVQDPEVVGEDLTEANMNPDVRGMDVAEAFKPSTYNVMIVANKFQTGFDQPRLVAMYVDKRLGGVQAVQTLSRLNRTYPGKDQTFVVDFVNDPEDVLEAFKPYYRRADITAMSDPNLIHELATNLDGAGLYTMEQLEGLANEVLAGESTGANSRIHAWTDPVVERFRDDWLTAKAEGDVETLEELVKLRRDIQSYINFYDFISQVIDMGDTDLLRRQLLFRLIIKNLHTPEDREAVSLEGVSLEYYAAQEQDTVQLNLDHGDGLEPITAVGSGRIHEKHRSKLNEIIQKLNERFGDRFGPAVIATMMDSVITSLTHDEELQAQAKVNSEAQFSESTKLRTAVINAFLMVYGEVPEAAEAVMADDDAFREIVENIPTMTYGKLRGE